MNLATSYMGLKLRSPVIVASSGITQSVEGVKRCDRAGAGAVVLKSIFEEEIDIEARALVRDGAVPTPYPEAREYLERYSREDAFSQYLKLIREVKQSVSIPVIASIHCNTAGGWTELADRVQEAGADGLELNVFVLPSDADRDPRDYESVYFEIARAVRAKAGIPIALKIGSYFSGLAETAVQLSRHVDALVLFNRFYRIDIDIEKMCLAPAEMFSHPGEILVPLRWIAILSGQVSCDLAATTGVHDGAGVVKQILAGAAAVQVCSALYRKRDVAYLGTMLDEVRDWMGRRGFGSVDEFRGKLRQSNAVDPESYERVQFMIGTSDRALD